MNRKKCKSLILNTYWPSPRMRVLFYPMLTAQDRCTWSVVSENAARNQLATACAQRRSQKVNQATVSLSHSPIRAPVPVQPHCTNAWWNRCKTDLNSFLCSNWRRPLGRPRITWMQTIQQDLKFSDLNMDDAVDLAQNRPLWRLMSTFGATHSQWCLPEMMMMMMLTVTTRTWLYRTLALSGHPHRTWRFAALFQS